LTKKFTTASKELTDKDTQIKVNTQKLSAQA